MGGVGGYLLAICIFNGKILLNLSCAHSLLSTVKMNIRYYLQR
jgi:hypothetical protein